MRKIAFLMVLAGLVGCGEAGDEHAHASSSCEEQTSAVPKIIGTWQDDYQTNHTITTTSWTWDGAYGGTSTIVSYSNCNNVVITQNAPNATYNPSKFNRIVYTTYKDNSFYYCTVDYGLDTQEAAEASTKTADASDPATTGCGGTFPWTKLTYTP